MKNNHKAITDSGLFFVLNAVSALINNGWFLKRQGKKTGACT
jgi:hypothetical protein